MRRIFLWLLVLIFLTAGSLGCQKRLRISGALPVAPRSDYDRFAHIIVDVCDPARHSNWLEPKSEPEKFIRLTCAAGMEKMAEKMEKIQNEKLKGLIKRYQNFKKSEVGGVQQKEN